jgi:hypothetical protein
MTTSTFPPDREAFRQMLATLAAKTKTKIPELNGRVEKAVRLALAGDVELHADGSATVYSSSDPTRRYEIIEGTCTCRDWEKAPQHLCQHRLSAGLVRRTYALLPQELPCEAFPENDPGPVEELPPTPPPAGQPLPEAPASVNVRVSIGGREVQWTLRDSDEARLAVRLEALLARYPVPQAATPAQPLSAAQHGALAQHKARTGYCAVHETAMQLNTKDGRSWYSHRLPEGGFCKGK